MSDIFTAAFATGLTVGTWLAQLPPDLPWNTTVTALVGTFLWWRIDRIDRDLTALRREIYEHLLKHG
ncbi:MAG: hypothetical protein ACREVM_04865 [Burkholderiales bacterium]